MKRLLVCGKSLFLLLLLYSAAAIGNSGLTSVSRIGIFFSYQVYWEAVKAVLGSLMFGACGCLVLAYFCAQCTGKRLFTHGRFSESVQRVAPDFLRLFGIFFACTIAFYLLSSLLTRSLNRLMLTPEAVMLVVGLLRGLVMLVLVFWFFSCGCALFMGAYGLGGAIAGAGAFLQRNMKRMLLAAPCAWLVAMMLGSGQSWWMVLALRIFGIDRGYERTFLSFEPSLEALFVTCGAAFALIALAERRVQVTVDTGAAKEFWKLFGLSFITCGIYHYFWVCKVSTRIKTKNPIGKGLEPVVAVVLSVLFRDLFNPFWIFAEDGGLAEIAAQRGMRYDVTRWASFFWMLALPIVVGLLPMFMHLGTLLDGMEMRRFVLSMYPHLLLASCGSLIALYGFIKRMRIVCADDSQIGG